MDGRVAIVTGSTRGIGWATARLLASRGMHVVVCGRDDSTVAERVAELTAAGAACSGSSFDVADAQAAGDAVRDVFREHRRLDVLVANAGVLDDALLGMIGTERARATFAVNALGVLHVLEPAARLMARTKDARPSIVALTSIVATQGNPGQVAYGGAKAAVIGMVRSAARELAPQGIRVNAVAPGFIDTDMTRALPAEVFGERVRSIAMGRAGTPEDVARVVAFLAGDDSAYVTGQVIGVDGGMVV